jgi:hypothetical protein
MPRPPLAGPIFLLATLTACTGEDGGDRTGSADAGVDTPDASVDTPDAAALVAGRTFEHRIPGCVSDGLLNCAPTVHFCDDGRAEILVTDILNAGTWVASGDGIVASFPVADVPETIRFALAGDGEQAVDDWLAWEWLRVAAPAFSPCRD